MVLNIKDFPKELHKELKVLAAMKEVPMRELIINALEEYLKKQKKGG